MLRGSAKHSRRGYDSSGLLRRFLTMTAKATQFYLHFD
jgi:hypothetical protein